MAGCIFCTIVAKETTADLVYEDDDVVAFRDVHPKYPVHLLVVPKLHLPSAAALGGAHDALAGKCLRVGAELARKAGLAESGFRLLTNTGLDAGQLVPHLHVHVLGGGPLRPI